jgi:DNA-binding transcriptional LysR family regulator
MRISWSHSKESPGTAEFPMRGQGMCVDGHALNWDDLRILLAAGEASSLAGAARLLGVKHSTISRRLDALEESLGLRLFLRDRTGLTLTEAGVRVLDRVRKMEQLAVDIQRTAAEPDDAVSGTVRVTTSESFTGFLVRRLTALGAIHPKLVVEVLTTNARVDLLHRDADFAVRFMATTEPELMQRRLVELGWALYGSRDYIEAHGRPSSASDLRGHRVVGFGTPMAGVPGAQWLRDHAEGAHVVMRADSLVAVLNATSMGMGLSVLPCFMGMADANLVRLSDEVLGTRVVWLVAHPDVARIPRVRTVIDFVVAEMKAAEPVLSGMAR